MNAIELVIPQGGSAGVFMCMQCRSVHGNKKRADECCTPQADEISRYINAELEKWNAEIAGEKLSGNVVKEHYAKGVVSGFRMALAIIDDANSRQTISA